MTTSAVSTSAVPPSPQQFGDISVTINDANVALVEIHRPPHNFFSLEMLYDLADAFEFVDDAPAARSILFATEGKNFCGGADFSGEAANIVSAKLKGRHIYDEAVRLFSCRKPVVAAVQGAAIGGGLGLAAMADFRVGGPSTRMASNFARLGFHQGFGLSVTLPAIVGQQHALRMLYTGARLKGDEAKEIGLLDCFVDDDMIRQTAHGFAADIAASAPLAVESIRQTMRGHLAVAVAAATEREKAEQERLQQTEDWKEGTRAMAERRPPNFQRR